MSTRSALIAFFTAVAACAAPLQAAFHDHIGLQLWSLREYFKTDDLVGLDQAQRLGLKEVETAGTGNLTPEQFRAALDARGLTAVSAHVQYPDMEKDVAGVVNAVKTLGAKYAICPWIPHEGAFDAATMQRAAENFNKWGAAFRAAGIKFGYHAHGYEFVPGIKPGLTMFDELVAATKPEDVCFQLDVFWAYIAGGDPVQLLNKYGSRWVSLHLKDIRAGVERAPGTSHAEPEDSVAVGAGVLDWKAVIGTAEKVGVKLYIIEDETPAPLENIPLSVKFLHDLKL